MVPCLMGLGCLDLGWATLGICCAWLVSGGLVNFVAGLDLCPCKGCVRVRWGVGRGASAV